MVEEEESLRSNMCALAILSCRPTSHPFQERHISLHEPVKIGRSVARARPTASNGIFDCKVLSRHHALLWYEAEKFYLQDTKSSNGTFINNQRLCKSGEESPMREVFSGDLIQFGVEVVENNRRGEKITHGCIIATITLYHPDGREAKPAPFLNDPNQPGTTIQSQDLYQLAHYLQEALHREKMLEQKLSSLQQLVHNTQEAAEGGWQALIDEDKLLSRLEMLENQLHIYSKNHSEDSLRQELVALQEDKINYETTAKESLRRVLQEKLDAVTKLSDLERSLTSAEGECSHLKEVCESSQEELKQLATRYQDQLKEVLELQEKLQEAEKNYQEEVERAEKEKQELMDKLEDMIQQESTLTARIESLQADNDFAREQLTAMKAKLELKKETNQEEDKALELLEGISSEDIIPLGEKDSVPENLEEKLKELQTQIEVYKAKVEESDSKLKESSEKIEQLQKELETAQHDSKQSLAKMATLEVQLKESQKQSSSSEELIQSLEGHIKELEGQLKQRPSLLSRATPLGRAADDSDEDHHLDHNVSISADNTLQDIDSTLVTESDDTDSDTVINGHSDGDSVSSAAVCVSADAADVTAAVSASSTSSSSSLPDITSSEHLKAALEAQRTAEEEAQKYREEMGQCNAQLEKSSADLERLRTQYFEAQQAAKEKADLVTDLQDQLRKAEADTKDVKQQILDLRGELESERTKHNQTSADLDQSRSQLQDAQQAAKQSHNEAEQLRNKVKVLQEESETERKERQSSPRHDSPHYRASNRSRAEFQALKEECTHLRIRINAVETEMKMSRKENLQLSSEYNKLQESYKHLEALKEKLATSEMAFRQNLTDAQKDAEKSKQELQDSGEEVDQLRSQCQQYSQELNSLRAQLSLYQADFTTLATRSKKISLVSSIPLLILLFAVLLALYPTLEQITATSS